MAGKCVYDNLMKEKPNLKCDLQDIQENIMEWLKSTYYDIDLAWYFMNDCYGKIPLIGIVCFKFTKEQPWTSNFGFVQVESICR